MSGHIPSLRFRAGLRINRLARDDEIKVRERLEELGLKSAVKGLGIVALRHLPLDYGSISQRMLERDGEELIGAGSSAAVYRRPGDEEVTKYFLSDPDCIEGDLRRHMLETGLTTDYFQDVAIPSEVDGLRGEQVAFVTHRQAYVGGVRDIFSMSEEIIAHKGSEYIKLRSQVGYFLARAMALKRDEEAFPDINGLDNLSVEGSRSPELRLIDLLPLRYEGVLELNRVKERVKILEDIAA